MLVRGLTLPPICLVATTATAARIVNVTVEPKLDDGKQLINIELLMDRVDDEVLAVLLDENTLTPLQKGPDP